MEHHCIFLIHRCFFVCLEGITQIKICTTYFRTARLEKRKHHLVSSFLAFVLISPEPYRKFFVVNTELRSVSTKMLLSANKPFFDINRTHIYRYNFSSHFLQNKFLQRLKKEITNPLRYALHPQSFRVVCPLKDEKIVMGKNLATSFL